MPWIRGGSFPCGSAGKESTCSVGDLDLIPGLGRSPGEGEGYPLQYSGLENSMDSIVHGITKSWTGLSNFHFQGWKCVWGGCVDFITVVTHEEQDACETNKSIGPEKHSPFIWMQNICWEVSETNLFYNSLPKYAI